MMRPYHHGDLPAALVQAALAILEREGLTALTLRAVARRAGVSHMAPAHHFGDLSGLLSELAAEGYRLFTASLEKAQSEPGTRSVARAAAQAYVAFARLHSSLFLLMFRSERLDWSRPSLAEAAARSERALMRNAGRSGDRSQDEPMRALDWAAPIDRALISRAVFRWSVVHGFAMLVIDGRLEPVLTLPGLEGRVEVLLDSLFETVFGPSDR